MSISGTVPHRVRISDFNARRFFGSGAASRGVSLIAPLLAAVAELHPSELVGLIVQRGELPALTSHTTV
ncbi:hypothetical protein EV186_103929 [Labedaea rhizosphaerae]|uniref:Uncharacterized protein n=1 Tax=Labedaea rhizosphaerae TaxID=598644 RepID=A0A4R6SCZ3_LABRH|nr:hypothetical protein EV186_103929 [Labedaea rhizosphaerae]